MGLKEKREMAAALEKWLPARQKELQEICGAEIPFDIDWDSFADDAKGISWLEHNGPQQVINACRAICTDAVGKEAVQEGIKKVALKNVPEVEDRKMTLADGVLELQCAFAKSPQGRFSYEAIRVYLEESL